jgi:hypothetical protein
MTVWGSPSACAGPLDPLSTRGMEGRLGACPTLTREQA